MSYSSEVLADSPLLYLRLGEAPGAGTAVDSSGNGRNGTYAGPPTLGATGLLYGDSDTAMGLATGSGQTASVASASWMNVSTITVEAIVKFNANVDNGSGDAIVSRLNSNLDWLLWRVFSSNVIEASVWNTAGTRYDVVAPSAAVNGTIYHVAFTFDGTNLKLYINGAVVATTAVSGTVRAGADPIEVGRYSASGATTPDGVIDEVAVYGSALSAARILAHYQASAAPVPITGIWGISA